MLSKNHKDASDTALQAGWRGDVMTWRSPSSVVFSRGNVPPPPSLFLIRFMIEIGKYVETSLKRLSSYYSMLPPKRHDSGIICLICCLLMKKNDENLPWAKSQIYIFHANKWRISPDPTHQPINPSTHQQESPSEASVEGSDEEPPYVPSTATPGAEFAFQWRESARAVE